jgi:hypothetical protein
MKRILLPLFLFSLIGISSAADIIVPSEESYHAPYTDEFTFTLVVSSEDYNGQIVVEDRWTEPCSVCAKEPALYNRTASDLGIGISYEDEFYISERTAHDLKVSVKVDTADVYCGLIIFTPIDAGGSGILSRGTWITMDMRGISVAPATSPTNKTALNITGFSSEKNLEIYLNQNSVGVVEITSGNNFTAAITLSEGDNEIVMKAVDSELRSNPIHITLDTTPPDAPIISPVPPSTVNKSTITISGTSEAESIVHISVNEIEKNNISASDSGDFTLPNIDLDVGNNTITAIAVDRAGNPSNESALVHVIYRENEKRIQLSADKTTTILYEGESATCNITALVVDETGTLMGNTTVTINFSIVSGNAVLLTREVETYGGGAATMVECSDAGDVTITAETSSPDIAGDSLMISFTSPKSALSSENETNETMNASGSDDKSGGRNIPGILIYILLAIAVVVAGFLLYSKIAKKRKGKAGGADDGLSWTVSAMKKKGEDYLITIDKDGKKKTIKLNEKLYKRLIKKRKMSFGKHTIVFKPKK